MPRSLRQRLTDKGWSEEEVNKALTIMGSENAPEHKKHFVKSYSPIIYWMALLISIIGNLLVSVILIPVFLWITELTTLIFVVGFIALVFGGFFTFLLHELEHINQKHHVMAGLFIPAIAVINVYIIVTLSNILDARILKLGVQQNPLLMAIVYVIGFIIPYVVYKIIDLKTNN
jgi:hypothetical protein